MSYKNQIKFLEESLKVLENKIKSTNNLDSSQLGTLQTQKNKFLGELNRLRKLQWEEDHERVEFDEDRDR